METNNPKSKNQHYVPHRPTALASKRRGSGSPHGRLHHLAHPYHSSMTRDPETRNLMMLFSPLIEQAVELAAQWHDGTYRKSRWRAPAFEPPGDGVLRVPVMAHVTAVALIVQRFGWPDAAVAAAFLHDVLEDQNRFGQTFRRDQLCRQMGEAVAALVEAVTEQKRDAEGRPRSWRARKEDYLARLRSSTPEAVAISLADKLHNLWTMNEGLQREVDLFNDGPSHRGLSAGPEEQCWFFEAVFSASLGFTDSRLAPMQARLRQEIDRFRALTGLPDGVSDVTG